jgi:hypothetical protein
MLKQWAGAVTGGVIVALLAALGLYIKQGDVKTQGYLHSAWQTWLVGAVLLAAFLAWREQRHETMSLEHILGTLKIPEFEHRNSLSLDDNNRRCNRRITCRNRSRTSRHYWARARETDFRPARKKHER